MNEWGILGENKLHKRNSCPFLQLLNLLASIGSWVRKARMNEITLLILVFGTIIMICY